MENLKSLTVNALRAKCREAGLPTSGNKHQLMKRLEDNMPQSSSPDLTNRISQLEKTIADLQCMFVSFQPSLYSSVLVNNNDRSPADDLQDNKVNTQQIEKVRETNSQAFCSADNVQVQQYSANVNVDRNIQQRTESAVQSATSVSLAAEAMPFNCQHLPHTYGDIVTHYAGNSISTPTVPCHVSSLQTRTVPTSSSASLAYNDHNRPLQSAGLVSSHQHVADIPVLSTSLPYNHQQFVNVPFLKRSIVNNQSLPPTFPSVPIQQNTNVFGNIREILTLLPEFNPSSMDSLNAIQFIKRVETLIEAYAWDERLIIFAVQQKLQGPAKYWVDSLQYVFQTWQQFKNRFLMDFPFLENAADIHIKLSQTKRQFNETPQEFYFKMFALGTRGGLTEPEIARHIINGINDPNLKYKISNDYATCNALFRDICSYCNYNDVASRENFR